MCTYILHLLSEDPEHATHAFLKPSKRKLGQAGCICMRICMLICEHLCVNQCMYV